MQRHQLLSKLKSPIWFRLFMLTSLPAALFSGIRVQRVDEQSSEISVRYSWFSKNPFKSIYFACLAMAAEMASGVLALVHTVDKQPSVSMLVFNMQAAFHKKAVGKIVFKCEDGDKIKSAIEQAIATGEGVTCAALSRGFDEEQNCVAEFTITWTFKQKKK
jgi:phage terminase large subunit-like protein